MLYNISPVVLVFRQSISTRLKYHRKRKLSQESIYIIYNSENNAVSLSNMLGKKNENSIRFIENYRMYIFRAWGGGIKIVRTMIPLTDSCPAFCRKRNYKR